jgi:protein TonB
MQSAGGEDNVWPDLAVGAARSGGTPTPGVPSRHWPALYGGVSCAIHLLLLVALGLLTRDLIDVPPAPPIRVSVLPTMATGEGNAALQPRMPEDRALDPATMDRVSPLAPDPVPTVAPRPPLPPQTEPERAAVLTTPTPPTPELIEVIPEARAAREPPPLLEPPWTVHPDLVPPVGSGRQEAPAATTPGAPTKEQSKPQASPPRPTGARYGQNPAPPYPSEARRRGWEGTVLLIVEIRENGRPERVTIKESSGHSVLDNAALGAVGRWTFVPAQQNGRPVRSVAEVPIIFSLQERR